MRTGESTNNLQRNFLDVPGFKSVHVSIRSDFFEACRVSGHDDRPCIHDRQKLQALGEVPKENENTANSMGRQSTYPKLLLSEDLSLSRTRPSLVGRESTRPLNLRTFKVTDS